MAVCFDHADSFELDNFDQNSHLIFWLKVNKDTVFEASILEYDRYEPPPGARSCLRDRTGPENQHLPCRSRAVSDFEAYGNIQKCF